MVDDKESKEKKKSPAEHSEHAWRGRVMIVQMF
jgi:hypothetical protein